MKKHFVFLLFLLNSTLLQAQSSRFKDGETLNVWATSGLNMRDKPDAKAWKIATIPYGAKVSVSANIGVKMPFEVEEFKNFTVKGYWLLVKYGNTEGYVFDGFLSRLPAPIKKENGQLEDYLTGQIKVVGQRYDVRIWDKTVDSIRLVKPNEKFDETNVRGSKQKYQSNIVSEFSFNESDSYRLTLPNLTVYEGYFLVKTYLFDPKTHVFMFNKKEGSVDMGIKEDGAGCAFQIKKIGNKIIIEGGCSC